MKNLEKADIETLRNCIEKYESNLRDNNLEDKLPLDHYRLINRLNSQKFNFSPREFGYIRKVLIQSAIDIIKRKETNTQIQVINGILRKFYPNDQSTDIEKIVKSITI